MLTLPKMIIVFFTVSATALMLIEQSPRTLVNAEVEYVTECEVENDMGDYYTLSCETVAKDTESGEEVAVDIWEESCNAETDQCLPPEEPGDPEEPATTTSELISGIPTDPLRASPPSEITAEDNKDVSSSLPRSELVVPEIQDRITAPDSEDRSTPES